MASSILLKDLEEKFFLCSVCLDQLKEPKLLPCLHRYCSDCLKTVIQASKEGKLNCPMCKQQCVIPDNGIDGYKTDFHMKNILEFIQLQKLLENSNLKECVSCLKKIDVSAYCFKCRDFLCNQCYNVHLTSKMFIDHQQRTLKLDNIERGTLTLEKLASLSENPRCRSHVEEHAKLCCTTCGNEPVCIICTYSKHRGHDLRDVTDISKTERDVLKRNLNELKKYTNKLFELPKEIEAAKQQLDENGLKEKQRLIKQHAQQADKMKSKIDDENLARERGLSDIEIRRKVENQAIDLKFEDELKTLKQKYAKLIEETQTKFDNECQQVNTKYDKVDEILALKVIKIDNNLRSLTTATELLIASNKDKLSEISDCCDQMTKRYENFTSTSSSILAIEVDWTDVRCIPDLNSACEALIEEMKRDFPDVESLSVVDIEDITEVVFDDKAINEYEGILANGWDIVGITCSGDGSIIITGGTSKEYSHITVINKKGRITRQDIFQSETQDSMLFRWCSYLKGFKIATVCEPDEIGIYDVSDGSYKTKFISEVIRDCPEDRWVSCVGTDPVNNHIMVGTDSRYVYVFDDQLNYSHTITLPNITTESNGITVHEGNILVCGDDGAYAVTMERPESEVVHEFTPPDQAEGEWCPVSVCTDQNRFIYILWSASMSDDHDISRLVKYSQDGQHLRAMEVVDNADCILAMAEALLVTKFGTIYTYGLTVT